MPVIIKLINKKRSGGRKSQKKKGKSFGKRKSNAITGTKSASNIFKRLKN